MTFDYPFLCLSLSVSGVIFQFLCTAKLSFASFYAIQYKQKCFQWPSACSHWWVRRVRLWDPYRHPAGWLLRLFQSSFCPRAYRCAAQGYIAGASLLSCGFIEGDTADISQGIVCVCVFCGNSVYLSVGLHSGVDQRSHKRFMADSCHNLGKTMTGAISSILVLEGLDPLSMS